MGPNINLLSLFYTKFANFLYISFVPNLIPINLPLTPWNIISAWQCLNWAILEKKPHRGKGRLRTYFFETPFGISQFFLLYPWEFHKFLLDSLEISSPKSKTSENSTLFFLGQAWKFHFVFH